MLLRGDIGCPLPDGERKERVLAQEKAALITGASSGIGLAIARTLGEEGYALTVAARRPEKLEAAAEGLRGEGLEVQSVAANMADEEELVGVFAKHREAYGRLDVLVNNAGVGIGAPMAEIQTKHLDMQLAVNLRALIIGTREGLPMLREAGAEHGKALLVNTASIAGKMGQGWLSIYAATKAAVINFTEGDPPRGGRRRRPVHGAGAGLRRHADDRVRQGPGARRGDDPARGHRRGGPLPAQHLAQLPRAGDRLHPPRRGHRRPLSPPAPAATPAPCACCSPPSATRATSSRRSR